MTTPTAETTPFTLTTTSPTTATVLVDGVDVSDDVVAVEFAQAARGPASLVLHLKPEAAITGDAIVTVVREPTDDELRARLGAWLAALDPVALDAEVRPRLTSMRDSYAAHAIAVLAENVRG